MRLLAASLIVLTTIVTVRAQEAQAPTLTAEQKLEIQSTYLALQVAELRAHNAELQLKIAQDGLNLTRAAAQSIMKRFEKPGYRLDLQRMEYVKEELKK